MVKHYRAEELGPVSQYPLFQHLVLVHWQLQMPIQLLLILLEVRGQVHEVQEVSHGLYEGLTLRAHQLQPHLEPQEQGEALATPADLQAPQLIHG